MVYLKSNSNNNSSNSCLSVMMMVRVLDIKMVPAVAIPRVQEMVSLLELLGCMRGRTLELMKALGME